MITHSNLWESRSSERFDAEFLLIIGSVVLLGLRGVIVSVIVVILMVEGTLVCSEGCMPNHA